MKKTSIFLVILLIVQTPVQASWWDSIKASYDDYKAKFDEGLPGGFTEAGKVLPSAVIGYFLSTLRRIILHRTNRSNELYERGRLLSFKRQYFEAIEEKLFDQKEELEGEWEQIQDDEKRIAKLQENLQKKLKQDQSRLISLFKKHILRRNEIPKSSEEIQQLSNDVEQFKAVVGEQKKSHLKRRERLADMIDSYQEQFRKFLKAEAEADDI